MTKEEDQSVFDDGCWVWTNSGRKVSFTNPRPWQFCIEDIAEGLSKVCRFAGQTNEQYSVADHCVNLVEFIEDHYQDDDPITAPDILLGALLHDAPEAYTSDVPSPFKRCLGDFKKYENALYDAISEKFGAAKNDWGYMSVVTGILDKHIICDEASLLFNNDPEWFNPKAMLGANIVVSVDWQEACDRYLCKFDELMDKLTVWNENIILVGEEDESNAGC